VIKAAALALGETRSPGAYESLAKLLNAPSWRDNIKVSALSGLAALQDERALEIAFRYTEKGNLPQVKAAALRLLGRIGRDDPRAFTLIADATAKAFSHRDLDLATAAGEALVSLGDPRGLAVLEQIDQDALISTRLKEQLRQFRELLRKVAAGAANPGVKQP